LSENAVVHHSKIVRRMTELGQNRPWGHVGSNVRFARKRPSSGHR
jgi:hypothetical protein